MARRAVVLMNLGGPDSLTAVRPFLYNLFSDPAIIGLPAPLRLPLAWLIAARRARTARGIYAQLGGSSPLLANTEAQARALEAALGAEYRCFVAMRYWHPLTAAAVGAITAWQPDEIILLPLYPQFSTTTTASSLEAWRVEAMRQGLVGNSRTIRSYPIATEFVAAVAALVARTVDAAETAGAPVRLLFSAHGLPLKIVAKGDPYPREIAGRDGVAVVVAPISFVSEHSETLVELDRDYHRLAETCGVLAYHRAPTVGTDRRFIAALAELVRGTEPQPAEPATAQAGITS